MSFSLSPLGTTLVAFPVFLLHSLALGITFVLVSLATVPLALYAFPSVLALTHLTFSYSKLRAEEQYGASGQAREDEKELKRTKCMSCRREKAAEGRKERKASDQFDERNLKEASPEARIRAGKRMKRSSAPAEVQGTGKVEAPEESKGVLGLIFMARCSLQHRLLRVWDGCCERIGTTASTVAAIALALLPLCGPLFPAPPVVSPPFTVEWADPRPAYRARLPELAARRKRRSAGRNSGGDLFGAVGRKEGEKTMERRKKASSQRLGERKKRLKDERHASRRFALLADALRRAPAPKLVCPLHGHDDDVAGRAEARMPGEWLASETACGTAANSSLRDDYSAPSRTLSRAERRRSEREEQKAMRRAEKMQQMEGRADKVNSLREENKAEQASGAQRGSSSAGSETDAATPAPLGDCDDEPSAVPSPVQSPPCPSATASLTSSSTSPLESSAGRRALRHSLIRVAQQQRAEEELEARAERAEQRWKGRAKKRKEKLEAAMSAKAEQGGEQEMAEEQRRQERGAAPSPSSAASSTCDDGQRPAHKSSSPFLRSAGAVVPTVAITALALVGVFAVTAVTLVFERCTARCRRPLNRGLGEGELPSVYPALMFAEESGTGAGRKKRRRLTVESEESARKKDRSSSSAPHAVSSGSPPASSSKAKPPRSRSVSIHTTQSKAPPAPSRGEAERRRRMDRLMEERDIAAEAGDAERKRADAASGGVALAKAKPPAQRSAQLEEAKTKQGENQGPAPASGKKQKQGEPEEEEDSKPKQRTKTRDGGAQSKAGSSGNNTAPPSPAKGARTASRLPSARPDTGADTAASPTSPHSHAAPPTAPPFTGPPGARTEGDGNCFYRAVIQRGLHLGSQLLPDEDTAVRYLRKELARDLRTRLLTDELELARLEYAPYAPAGPEGEGRHMAEATLKRVERWGADVEDVEAFLLASFLGVPIVSLKHIPSRDAVFRVWVHPDEHFPPSSRLPPQHLVRPGEPILVLADDGYAQKKKDGPGYERGRGHCAAYAHDPCFATWAPHLTAEHLALQPRSEPIKWGEGVLYHGDEIPLDLSAATFWDGEEDVDAEQDELVREALRDRYDTPESPARTSAGPSKYLEEILVAEAEGHAPQGSGASLDRHGAGKAEPMLATLQLGAPAPTSTAATPCDSEGLAPVDAGMAYRPVGVDPAKSDGWRSAVQGLSSGKKARSGSTASVPAPKAKKSARRKETETAPSSPTLTLDDLTAARKEPELTVSEERALRAQQEQAAEKEAEYAAKQLASAQRTRRLQLDLLKAEEQQAERAKKVAVDAKRRREDRELEAGRRELKRQAKKEFAKARRRRWEHDFTKVDSMSDLGKLASREAQDLLLTFKPAVERHSSRTVVPLKHPATRSTFLLSLQVALDGLAVSLLGAVQVEQYDKDFLVIDVCAPQELFDLLRISSIKLTKIAVETMQELDLQNPLLLDSQDILLDALEFASVRAADDLVAFAQRFRGGIYSSASPYAAYLPLKGLGTSILRQVHQSRDYLASERLGQADVLEPPWPEGAFEPLFSGAPQPTDLHGTSASMMMMGHQEQPSEDEEDFGLRTDEDEPMEEAPPPQQQQQQEPEAQQQQQEPEAQQQQQQPEQQQQQQPKPAKQPEQQPAKQPEQQPEQQQQQQPEQQQQQQPAPDCSDPLTAEYKQQWLGKPLRQALQLLSPPEARKKLLLFDLRTGRGEAAESPLPECLYSMSSPADLPVFACVRPEHAPAGKAIYQLPGHDGDVYVEQFINAIQYIDRFTIDIFTINESSSSGLFRCSSTEGAKLRPIIDRVNTVYTHYLIKEKKLSPQEACRPRLVLVMVNLIEFSFFHSKQIVGSLRTGEGILVLTGSGNPSRQGFGGSGRDEDGLAPSFASYETGILSVLPVGSRMAHEVLGALDRQQAFLLRSGRLVLATRELTIDAKEKQETEEVKAARRKLSKLLAEGRKQDRLAKEKAALCKEDLAPPMSDKLATPSLSALSALEDNDAHPLPPPRELPPVNLAYLDLDTADLAVVSPAERDRGLRLAISDSGKGLLLPSAKGLSPQDSKWGQNEPRHLTRDPASDVRSLDIMLKWYMSLQNSLRDRHSIIQSLHRFLLRDVPADHPQRLHLHEVLQGALGGDWYPLASLLSTSLKGAYQSGEGVVCGRLSTIFKARYPSSAEQKQLKAERKEKKERKKKDGPQRGDLVRSLLGSLVE
ncbi:hypothetical protein JCM10213v2_001348 [Rhodosporidiobolus nylandii]